MSDHTFNRMCRVADHLFAGPHSWRPWKDAMRDAVPFYLDEVSIAAAIRHSTGFLSDSPNDSGMAPLLPFQPIAVVTPRGGAVFFDPDFDPHEPVEGAVWRARTILFVDMPQIHLVYYGVFYLIKGSDGVTRPSILDCSIYYADLVADMEPLKNIRDLSRVEVPRSKKDPAIELCILMGLEAFYACHYIDAPRHHVVVESPKHWRPGQQRPKLDRAADRPRIRLIAPEDVQRIYPHRTGVDTGRTVTPHARRGYSKTLRASRYKEPGKRVTVRPTWVGDGEWESGGIRYRVIHRPDASK